MAAASKPPVLVTGGSGFIGTNLVDRLTEHGYTVANLDVAPPKTPKHAGRWFECDLLHPERVGALVRNLAPAAVVHLGARTDLHGMSEEDYAANTSGTQNLLDSLASLDHPPRLIVASTRMVCRIGYQPTTDTDYAPSTPYGESKVATERIVRAFGYPAAWCIIRPTSIWGPWFGVPYKDFFLAVARGWYVHPRGATINKSFGYVGNSAYQIQMLVEADRDVMHEKTLYLADPEPIEVGDWASQIKARTSGRKLRGVPLPILRLAAIAGDTAKSLGWREPPITAFRLDNLMAEMIYDTSPLDAIAPDPPFDLASAIDRTVDWLWASGELDVVPKHHRQ